MELFKYIVKFIYRIRWWMVIFPCIAGIIAWFLTRNLLFQSLIHPRITLYHHVPAQQPPCVVVLLCQARQRHQVVKQLRLLVRYPKRHRAHE